MYIVINFISSFNETFYFLRLIHEQKRKLQSFFFLIKAQKHKLSLNKWINTLIM